MESPFLFAAGKNDNKRDLQNEEFRIKNGGVLKMMFFENDDFSLAMMSFVFKMMNFAGAVFDQVLTTMNCY